MGRDQREGTGPIEAGSELAPSPTYAASITVDDAFSECPNRRPCGLSGPTRGAIGAGVGDGDGRGSRSRGGKGHSIFTCGHRWPPLIRGESRRGIPAAIDHSVRTGRSVGYWRSSERGVDLTADRRGSAPARVLGPDPGQGRARGQGRGVREGYSIVLALGAIVLDRDGPCRSTTSDLERYLGRCCRCRRGWEEGLCWSLSSWVEGLSWWCSKGAGSLLRSPGAPYNPSERGLRSWWCSAHKPPGKDQFPTPPRPSEFPPPSPYVYRNPPTERGVVEHELFDRV